MIMGAISEFRRSTLSGSIIYVGPDFSDDACGGWTATRAVGVSPVRPCSCARRAGLANARPRAAAAAEDQGGSSSGTSRSGHACSRRSPADRRSYS